MAAALGAMQEAMRRGFGIAGGVSGFTCSNGGPAANQVECQTSAIVCSAVASTSNLNNGCQYAMKNGFDWTAGQTNVRIQSNDGQTANLRRRRPVSRPLLLGNRPHGARIPQMFSAIGGSAQGTVAAIATAAIAASIRPGRFLRHEPHRRLQQQ